MKIRRVKIKKSGILFIMSACMLIAQIAVILTHKTLPPQVPMLYSQKWGESRLVSPEYLWIIPGMCVLLTLINLLLLRFTKHDALLKNTIVWSIPIIVSLSTITLFNIISIST